MKPPVKKIKVALIHNIMSPYRVALFNHLAAVPQLALYIYFLASTDKSRKWEIPELSGKFTYKVLPGLTFNFHPNKDLFAYRINPSIAPELIRNKYDIIVSVGYASFTNHLAFLLCKIYRKPFVLCSESTINEPSLFRSVSLPLIKLIIRHSDALIAYGTRAKEYLIHLGAPSNRIFMAYNTVDTDFFKRESSKLRTEGRRLKGELGIENKSIILYVGQLIERKGIKYLLKAYSRLKRENDVACLIVGDGPQRTELVDLCTRENIKDVFFVGHKQLREMAGYYVISDIFVLPSTQEVWGLVLNEAMACGLPVVTTDKVGASVDLVKDGVNGYVVEAGHVEQLYQAMRKILSSPELKLSMGKKSQDVIDAGFGVEKANQGFTDAILTVASSRGLT